MRAPRAWPGGRLDTQAGHSIPVGALTAALRGCHNGSFHLEPFTRLEPLLVLRAHRVLPRRRRPPVLHRPAGDAEARAHGEVAGLDARARERARTFSLEPPRGHR